MVMTVSLPRNVLGSEIENEPSDGFVSERDNFLPVGISAWNFSQCLPNVSKFGNDTYVNQTDFTVSAPLPLLFPACEDHSDAMSLYTLRSGKALRSYMCE